MDEFVARTLNEIKEKQISPKPYWRISLPNYACWTLFSLMIGLSAVSFALVVHLASELEWDAYDYLTLKRLRFILTILPYFWVALLIVFAVTSFINIRNTRKGYRYSTMKIMGIILGVSFGLGGLLYVTRAEEAINGAFAGMIPQYHLLVNTKERFWTQPDEGLLGGKILLVRDQGFDLQDFTGNRWIVIPDANLYIRPKAQVKREIIIKVIGEKEAQQMFRAKEIRPWEQEGRVRMIMMQQ